MGAPRRIRTYDPRIRSPMLYPAELGARRSAIQVIGAPPVKRNSAHRSAPAKISASTSRSAGEVETADPGGLPALDSAARNFPEQIAVAGIGDREGWLAPE